jgi:hypothetical protein
MKFKYKRSSKVKGLAAVGTCNTLRAYYVSLNGVDVGTIGNVSCHALSNDFSRQWRIIYFARPKNLVLKIRFDEDKIADAKKFFEDTYDRIMKNENGGFADFKEQMLAVRDIKLKEKE